MLAAIVYGCRLPDSYIDEHEEIIEEGDLIEWTKDQNIWIYSQMKYHYLWCDELKDSLDYDYTLEPSRFYESMKVPQDRFSYCTVNDEFVDTKGTDLNESVVVDSVYMRDGLAIGYFKYAQFATETDLTDIVLPMKEAGIQELIIDLRGNPGGYVSTCIQLASYIAPMETLGKVFCVLKYNRNVSAQRQKEYGTPYTYYYLKDDVVTKGRNLGLKRVLFLADGRSASCSELLVNCIAPYLPVVLIGTTTVGKDVGMYSLKGRKYKYILEPITFRSYNADDIPVPVTGLVPDIEVTQTPFIRDGKTIDPALEAAFAYIDNN